MDSIRGSLAEAAQRHLENYGVSIRGDWSRLTWSQAQPMTLDVDGQRIDVAILCLPRLSATDALQAAHAVSSDAQLLVIGPRIHESSAETFRARGVWYLDEAGNAYVRHPGLVLDVRGRRGAQSPIHDEHLTVDGPRNPFTPKRAQVVLVLLSKPELADAPFREIADRAGVSIGMVKSTVDTLQITGFFEHTAAHRRLVRGGELLDLWASAYPGGLGRANTLLVAHGDVQNWSLPEGVTVAVSGEQAVPDVIRHPESLVLYVDTGRDKRPPPDLIRKNRWHRDPHGNVVIRKLFWRNLSNDRDSGVAPAALVYADLLASHEPRQVEVAHEMRTRDERLVCL